MRAVGIGAYIGRVGEDFRIVEPKPAALNFSSLNFDVAGGSGIDTFYGVVGSTVDLSKYVPTREGYEFTGWYSDPELTNKITSVTLSSNAKIYAGWKKLGTLTPIKNAKLDITSIQAFKRFNKLTWTKVDGADGYQIFRSRFADKGFGTKPFFTAIRPYYLNTLRDPSATYYYKVRAFKTTKTGKVFSPFSEVMLDEPTNHLDIDSKEVFEDALLDYPGTMIVVSHDRYFLNKIPTRILELGSEGFTQYLGKYDYYVEKKSSIDSGRKYLRELSDTSKLPAGGNQSRGGGSQFGDQSGRAGQSRGGTAAGPGAGLSGTAGTGPDMNAAAGGTAFDPPAGSAEERAAKKKIEAERRRQEREKQALEDLIAKLEGDIAGIEAEMCKPANLSNSKKLRELSEKAADKKDELDAAYDKWLEM